MKFAILVGHPHDLKTADDVKIITSGEPRKVLAKFNELSKADNCESDDYKKIEVLCLNNRKTRRMEKLGTAEARKDAIEMEVVEKAIAKSKALEKEQKEAKVEVKKAKTKLQKYKKIKADREKINSGADEALKSGLISPKVAKYLKDKNVIFEDVKPGEDGKVSIKEVDAYLSGGAKSEKDSKQTNENKQD